jgi:hypothetical protein
VAPLGSEALDLSDLAHLAVEAQLLVLAELVLVAQLPVLAEVALVVQLLEVLPVRAVEAALLLLLSPQSFSASTARNSPTPVQPTYERVPSTR